MTEHEQPHATPDHLEPQYDARSFAEALQAGATQRVDSAANDVDTRFAKLEHRLAEMERRLAQLELAKRNASSTG